MCIYVLLINKWKKNTKRTNWGSKSDQSIVKQIVSSSINRERESNQPSSPLSYHENEKLFDSVWLSFSIRHTTHIPHIHIWLVRPANRTRPFFRERETERQRRLETYTQKAYMHMWTHVYDNNLESTSTKTDRKSIQCDWRQASETKSPLKRRNRTSKRTIVS